MYEGSTLKVYIKRVQAIIHTNHFQRNITLLTSNYREFLYGKLEALTGWILEVSNAIRNLFSF